ncbi:hypothetical protein EOD41_04375 [Mucilaginibacter limnophilus]|uniref:Uncharacterized protein n=1 Tax=Mucilaginibacter limnophilus TaxID=1932778 RepID=A0A3S2Y3L5_9SPHI|nr:hypothetical protein [Mucilaginibacter limnophilus]RVU01208.1 hypothetical protein EOD41_04375 [Mucilaginibacter limnophilus]
MLRCLMEKKEWDDEEYLVRAAGYCLLKFGHVYIWPVDELSADLELTISAYDRLLSISDNQINESFQPQLDQELTELKARLKSISSR